MPRKTLLVAPHAAQNKAMRRLLADAGGDSFEIDWVPSLSDAVAYLKQEQGNIDAIIASLTLPDSLGISTFERLFAASAAAPILILIAGRDEGIARCALRHGAQDYLLEEEFNGDSLFKALTRMRERSIYERALGMNHVSAARAMPVRMMHWSQHDFLVRE